MAMGMDDDDVYAMLKERKSKKIPRKKREGKSAGKGMSEDEKREAIRAGLVRKKGCEKRALDIVERMIETGVDKEWLRDSVRNSPWFSTDAEDPNGSLSSWLSFSILQPK